MFTSAVVKTPCKNMVEGISHAGLGLPNYTKALTQHREYVRAMEACGLAVTTLEPEEAFPDSCFIEDTCLVTRDCAVITRPGADSRRGEIEAVARAMAPLGLPMDKIRAPGTLDAGDVMMVGDHFYVGLSDRTNQEGADQLAAILALFGMTVSVIALSSVLHLKTGISYLENNVLLAFGEFLSKPELMSFDILEVAVEEAYAANSVWINGRVIVPTGFPKTLEMIRDKGYDTIEVDVSEFRKLDGGLSCLSLRF